jgi:hypothetical protein
MSNVTDINRERAVRNCECAARDRAREGDADLVKLLDLTAHDHQKETIPGPQAMFRYKGLDLVEDFKGLGPEVLLSELTGLCVYVQAMKE